MWTGATVEIDGRPVPLITLSDTKIRELAREKAREQIITAVNKYRVDSSVGSSLVEAP